jgi:hypothetical protein
MGLQTQTVATSGKFRNEAPAARAVRQSLHGLVTLRRGGIELTADRELLGIRSSWSFWA